MISAPIPANEAQRIKELQYYNILDTEAEKDYDDIVELASNICGTKISLVSLVDTDRQWFKAKHGLDADETPREIAFCAHALLGNDIFIIPDATKDERFHDNPLVTENPNIRFYAGMPLTTSDGYNLGTLCVIDDAPKTLNDTQVESLKTLRNQVIRLFELKRRNYDLQETLNALTEANEIKTKLLSIIGHDLKSPIANLDMFLQVIEQGYISVEESKQHISALRDSLNSTNILLSNLFSWAKSQMDAFEFKTDKIDLYSIIDDEIDRVRQIANSKKNELINQVPKDTFIIAEKNQISFIIRNLLNNSIKFTEKGSITVSISRTPKSLTLRISDTGKGMDQDTVQNLFQWRKIQSNLGTRGEKGTGFGLLVVKEFVDNHNGSIRVESMPGQGSTFIIIFLVDS